MAIGRTNVAVITRSGLDKTWTEVERVRIIAIEEPAPINAAIRDTNITSFRRTKKNPSAGSHSRGRQRIP